MSASDRDALFSERLRELAAAGLAISRQPTLQEAMSTAACSARELVGAQLGGTLVLPDGDWSQVESAVSVSGDYACYADLAPAPGGDGIYARVSATNQPLLLSAAELAAHRPAGNGRPPLRGWIGAPLIGARGDNIGVIHSCDKCGGDFDAFDLAVLTQLAHFASAAIVKARLLDDAQQAQLRAEEASRLKDDFLAAVSHELRTPLNAIAGWAQLLVSEELAADERDHAHQVVLRNARTLGELVDDLIDVSRIVSGKIRLSMQPVDFADVVESVLASLRPAAAGKKLLLSVDIDASAPLVFGDLDRLHQVASNLLMNAIKFTDQGGQVTVRLRATGGAVELSIADSGEGLDPAVAESIFEPFRQGEGGTTRRHGGLGLGLSIARDLVELHGGAITAHSEGRGRGTTVRVSLPVTALERGRPDTTPPPSPRPVTQLDATTLRGIDVLVVDDEEDARGLLDTMLRTHGARVVTAGSAREGLSRLDARRFHVIVADLGMPELDGFDLIRRVRARSPLRGGSLPVVALTAHARPEDRTRALLAGFDAHVTKPVEVRELVAVVHAAVARHRRDSRHEPG